MSPSGEFACFVRRGLNFVPLRPSPGDQFFNIVRYGVDVGGARVLVCHIHGHPSSCVERNALLQHLISDVSGDLVCVVGDFNCLPSPDSRFHTVWPSSHTFRHSGSDAQFVSTPDGFLVTPHLASIAHLFDPHVPHRLQHRPIGLSLAMQVLLEDSFTWDRGCPGQPVAWHHSALTDFVHRVHQLRSRILCHPSRAVSAGDLIVTPSWQHDLDGLWSDWLRFSHGPHSSFRPSSPWGGLVYG